MAADFFKVDPGDVIAALKDLSEKDAPFITAYALTKTAQDIEAAEIASMASVFDRPTDFTMHSLYVKPATKTDLQAMVLFKDDAGSIAAWRYLGPEVEGGDRHHKAFELRLIRAGLMKVTEFAEPGRGIKLDGNGNIPGSTLEMILSQVGAAEQWSGYQANATKKSLAKRKRQQLGRYFVLRPDDGPGRARAVQPGIYYRAGLKEIVPVIVFATAPKYKKRFPFHDVAQATFDARLLVNAREGFQRYVVDKAKKKVA